MNQSWQSTRHDPFHRLTRSSVNKPSEHTPEHRSAELLVSLPDKVIRLHEALDARDIPHAIGGAISLGYHKQPRATVDIYLNIFLTPDQRHQAMNALAEVFEIPDPSTLDHQLAESAQGSTVWGKTVVDIFLVNTDFHRSMSQRTRLVPFHTAEIPILSGEDLIITKALFDRPKDWIDIEGIYQFSGPELDHEYINQWLQYFLGETDRTIDRITELETRFQP